MCQGKQSSRWPQRTGGVQAHHGRQRDALVPLRVGRLLQDLAAELEDTEGWWLEQPGHTASLWTSHWRKSPEDVEVGTGDLGQESLKRQSLLAHSDQNEAGKGLPTPNTPALLPSLSVAG